MAAWRSSSSGPQTSPAMRGVETVTTPSGQVGRTPGGREACTVNRSPERSSRSARTFGSVPGDSRAESERSHPGSPSSTTRSVFQPAASRTSRAVPASAMCCAFTHASRRAQGSTSSSSRTLASADDFRYAWASVARPPSANSAKSSAACPSRRKSDHVPAAVSRFRSGNRSGPATGSGRSPAACSALVTSQRSTAISWAHAASGASTHTPRAESGSESRVRRTKWHIVCSLI